MKRSVRAWVAAWLPRPASSQPRIQIPHHQLTRPERGISRQRAMPIDPALAEPFQMSLATCFGRTRLKNGMNQPPTAQPGP